jgi:dolichyl-phosphate-mannose--protein O-mannosyl transferase
MCWCYYWGHQNVGIFGFGQPFVWTTGFCGCVIATISAIGWFATGSLNSKQLTVVLLLVGYWASWLPFAFVPRTIFFYHYIVPAIFSGFALFAFVDQINDRKLVGWLATVLAVLAVFGLVFWGALVYGYPVDNMDSKVWQKIWREERKE